MLPFTRPTIGDEELNAVREVLESRWLASGPKASHWNARSRITLAQTPTLLPEFLIPAPARWRHVCSREMLDRAMK